MENKKTYLVLTPFFPSDESHVGSYVFDQINEISKQSDFNIEIVKTVSLFSSEKDYEFHGFNVRIFKTWDFPYFFFHGIFNSINKKRFQFLLSKNKIEDVSISHSHVAYPASYLVEDLSCKKIAQHHGLDVLQLLNGRSGILRKIQRNYLIKNTINHLNRMDLNIGVSKLVLEQFKVFKLYESKSEYVLYNGVDRTKFYPIDSINKSDKFQIGCVANFWRIKDQISLIKAVELIITDGKEDIELRLIGSGDELAKCKQYVIDKELERYVFFEKEMLHDELNLFYNEIYLFVLPSYYEALGCVYLESWATNTPIISIKEQGIAELIPINEIDNLLADKKLPESLKEKIIGEYNRKRCYPFNEKYDIINTINNFLTLNIFKNDN